ANGDTPSLPPDARHESVGPGHGGARGSRVHIDRHVARRLRENETHRGRADVHVGGTDTDIGEVDVELTGADVDGERSGNVVRDTVLDVGFSRREEEPARRYLIESNSHVARADRSHATLGICAVRLDA